MKKNIFFILIAAFMLAPWPVVYAYDSVNADSEAMMIQTADTASAPQLSAYGGAIGSVTAGDLFEVDMTGSTEDMIFRLLITNADELIPNYRFMNLKVGIYVQTTDGGWEELTMRGEGEQRPIYISMQGGAAEFTLPGGANYKITIDKGCFYCYGIEKGTKGSVPVFYLETS